MLAALRRTNGTAVAVLETELAYGVERMAKEVGVWGSPEAGACVAAYQLLLHKEWIRPQETVVIFNTGSAFKYLET